MNGSYTASGVSGSFNNGFQTPFQPAECSPDPTTPACQAAIAAINAAIRQNAETFTGGYQSTLTGSRGEPISDLSFWNHLYASGRRWQNRQGESRQTLVEGEKLETQRRQDRTAYSDRCPECAAVVAYFGSETALGCDLAGKQRKAV